MIKNKDHTHDIAFVILAAGESRRMGSIKQLLQWRNKSLIDHLIDKSIDSAASDTFVVLGANASEIAKTIIDKPVRTIYNSNWESGLGSSISAAVTYISSIEKAYSGILISLVDQPLISTMHFDMLIERFVSGEEGIVATSNSGNPGVPALFSEIYFKDLMQLNNAPGARSVIAANRDDTTLIQIDDKYIDLDTPKEFEEFLKQHG